MYNNINHNSVNTLSSFGNYIKGFKAINKTVTVDALFSPKSLPNHEGKGYIELKYTHTNSVLMSDDINILP